MNLRCIYCQTPFTLSRNEMLTAIVNMNEKSMNHYDAHCPRCRRANSISRQRMELFFPNWQEAAKEQASQPVEETPPTPSTAHLKTTPVSKEKKAASKPRTRAGKAKPAAKPAAKKPAAKKTSTTKTSTTKTTAKKTSTKSTKK